jgi:hypothetical protein
MATATTEQAAGLAHLREAADTMRTAAEQATHGLGRQKEGSAAIDAAATTVSQAAQEIAKGIAAQERDAARIETALARIRAVPAKNRDLALGASEELKSLVRDLEALHTEISRLVLPDDVDER